MQFDMQSVLTKMDWFFAKAALAAMVATYFTFLPSFIFIFAGGPIIETTHRQSRVTAPLTVVTAAVVGVIVNLAIFFAHHVLWPADLSGRFEWPLLTIGVSAFVVLFGFRVGVIPTILACGAAGQIYQNIDRPLFM